MILIRSQGRLGNQLFLWAAVANERKPRELIVLFGFIELKEFMAKRPPSVIWFPLGHMFDGRVKRLFNLVGRIFGGRVLGRISQTSSPAQLTRSRGVIPIWVFDAGLCQSERLAPLGHVLDYWRPEDFVSDERGNRPWESDGRQRADYAFVHVRRGDYADFSTFGREVALPASWYLEQMQEIRDNHAEIEFKILSDDPAWALTNFGGLSRVQVVSADAHESFAIMANASHGVLSPSTFSWWAARIAAHKEKGKFIAPTYWLGFAASAWYPDSEIKASFLVYRGVH